MKALSIRAREMMAATAVRLTPNVVERGIRNALIPWKLKPFWITIPAIPPKMTHQP
jgi:hypothetical protein